MSLKREKPSREEVFRSLPVPRALRIMVLPAVVSQLIVLVYNMADTFYVAQTDDPYMVAATSLILPVFNISTCLAGLAGVGGGDGPHLHPEGVGHPVQDAAVAGGEAPGQDHGHPGVLVAGDMSFHGWYPFLSVSLKVYHKRPGKKTAARQTCAPPVSSCA